MRHLGLLLGVLLCTCFGVHKENFPTCDQCGFCKSSCDRKMQPGSSKYVVQPSTLRISKTSMMVDVVNTDNDVRFLLQGYGLQHGIFRVKLVEAEPVRERYEITAGMALVAEPIQEEFVYDGEKDGNLTFTLGHNKMLVSVNPLRIHFFINDEPVTCLNVQGLPKFEHTRQKQSIHKGNSNTTEVVVKAALESRKKTFYDSLFLFGPLEALVLFYTIYLLLNQRPL